MSSADPNAPTNDQARLSRLLAEAWVQAGGETYAPLPVPPGQFFDKLVAEAGDDEARMKALIDRLANTLNHQRNKVLQQSDMHIRNMPAPPRPEDEEFWALKYARQAWAFPSAPA